MGRKPNPLILEYFDRGPKLNDNSNRYPHTCKQCGENFPKGRIDSLTTHITKRCPAISENNRLRACLELHGINAAKAAERHHTLLANAQHTGPGPEQQNLPQWSALETLAEASRQVDLNENTRIQNGSEPPPADATITNDANDGFTTDRFELQEQFTLDNPPGTYDSQTVTAHKDVTPPPSDWTPEERLQALLQNETASPDVSNISVAVAATARLNPSFLDPSLAEPEAAAPSPVTEGSQNTEPSAIGLPLALPLPAPASDNTNAPPWGEISYVANPAPGPLLNDSLGSQMTHARGGVRMDTSDTQGRPRNSRARFSPARRKEVQEIRKIGACIRCRILRKNCGKGDPCDTCKKVLSPRVWRVGCVRTRLHEQLDLYSAGVQVVLSQNRLNALKEQLKPVNNGTKLQVSHFPETEVLIVVSTLCAMVDPSEALTAMRDNVQPVPRVIMIDQEVELIPDKIEKYMRAALPLFIEREGSNFMKVTLQTAQEQSEDKEEDVLKKALELWGLVEIIDRERQWTFLEKPAEEGSESRRIKETSDGNDADIYTMICMQLNAAAERKANQTSKSLLSLMHRLLQDSKTRINFKMFMAALIFLNCVEKTTWAFKAWEQAHLRPGWPLERDPGMFMQQGSDLANLLRMLLSIRKALPTTIRNDDGKLAAVDDDEWIVRFFERLDLDYDTVAQRQKKDDSEESPFSPVDSRSLELTLCSHLLLPNSP